MIMSGYFEHSLLFVITKTATYTDSQCSDPFNYYLSPLILFNTLQYSSVTTTCIPFHKKNTTHYNIFIVAFKVKSFTNANVWLILIEMTFLWDFTSHDINHKEHIIGMYSFKLLGIPLWDKTNNVLKGP